MSRRHPAWWGTKRNRKRRSRAMVPGSTRSIAAAAGVSQSTMVRVLRLEYQLMHPELAVWDDAGSLGSDKTLAPGTGKLTLIDIALIMLPYHRLLALGDEEGAERWRDKWLAEPQP